MEKRCQKCGSSVGAEQAFCPTCGAVIGMNLGATQVGGGWDMASTVVGQKLPSTPPPRSSAERRAHQTRPEAPPPPPAPRKSNTVLLAVIGFVAVLLIGGLIIFLLTKG
ncbi:MAG TPA: zinc-ribbon domain-containing protein [Pyrinomonadaceae bacterium]